MLAAAAAVAVFLFTVFVVLAATSKADERISAHSTRARLADYDAPATIRRRELRESFADRALAPTFGMVASLARRFVPSEYVEKSRHKLVLAGKAQDDDLDRFLVTRMLAAIAVPVFAFVVWRYTSLRGLNLWAVIAMVTLTGLLGPDASLNRMVADRQEKIRNKLPDVLDLLTISVEAGLGFEQALSRTVAMIPGPLASEFARMLGEIRAGASRADAMTSLDQRTDVSELRSFILAMLQADTFGVSVANILRTQALEMRVRRQQLAQEKAQKAPVKMLFPMVFCIMPALFVIIAGPAVMGIYHAFHQ
jgi:tight adherence protein C